MILCDRCQEIAYCPVEIFSNVLCMPCYNEIENKFNIWMKNRSE